MIYFDNEADVCQTNAILTDEIEKDSALYGYTSNETDFFETREHERMFIDFIRSKQQQIYNYGLPLRTTKLIREQANKIIKMQLAGVDTRVLYIEYDAAPIIDFEAETGQKIDENLIDEFIKYLKKRARKKEVTSIKPEWGEDRGRNGCSAIFSLFPEDLEIMQKWPIICTGFTLVNQNDDLSSTVLVHEMVHALVDRHKGVIENRLHSELLSIYMELVAAYELDTSGTLLNIQTISRLQSLKENLISQYYNDYVGIMRNQESIYIDSSLYAFALFEQYKNASDTARESLRREINEVFNGNRTLEETLERLSITEAEGSDIIRGHVKTLLK